jgi:hypothetical protein
VKIAAVVFAAVLGGAAVHLGALSVLARGFSLLAEALSNVRARARARTDIAAARRAPLRRCRPTSS